MQWLSRGVLDLRSKGCWFKTDRGYWVLFMVYTLYPMFCTGSIQEDKKTP